MAAMFNIYRVYDYDTKYAYTHRVSQTNDNISHRYETI